MDVQKHTHNVKEKLQLKGVVSGRGLSSRPSMNNFVILKFHFAWLNSTLRILYTIYWIENTKYILQPASRISGLA